MDRGNWWTTVHVITKSWTNWVTNIFQYKKWMIHLHFLCPQRFCHILNMPISKQMHLYIDIYVYIFNWGRITMSVIWAFILLECMITLLYNDNEDIWNHLIFSVICQSTTQFKIMWYWRIKWWLDRTLCLQFHLGCSSPAHVQLIQLTEIRLYRRRHRKMTIHSFPNTGRKKANT